MNKERLQHLNSLFAVSGEEDCIKQELKQTFLDLGLEIEQDRLGSIFGRISSKKKDPYTVMISSSLDHLGMMITKVNSDGTCSFLPLESFHPASLLHHHVWIQTRDYTLVEGIIVDQKHHYLESVDHKIEDLVIDLGMDEKEASSKITIGDLASFKPNLTTLNDVMLTGSGLFPSVMNEVVLELAEELKHEEFDFDIVVGGIGQSLIGQRGTKTITHVLQPDLGIVLTPFNGRVSNDGKSSGVMMGAYDKGMLPNRMLYHDVMEVLQPGVVSGRYQNDGSFIHKTQKGAACVSLGVLMRNMGTDVEMVNEKDIDALKQGIITYLKSLNEEKISTFLFGANR